MRSSGDPQSSDDVPQHLPIAFLDGLIYYQVHYASIQRHVFQTQPVVYPFQPVFCFWYREGQEEGKIFCRLFGRARGAGAWHRRKWLKSIISSRRNHLGRPTYMHA